VVVDDVTAPAYQDTHEQQPTPDAQDGVDGAVIAAVAALLLISATPRLPQAVLAAMTSRGVRTNLQAVTVALNLASRRTKHEPRIVGRSDVARAQARREAYYRAAYVTSAARRLYEAAWPAGAAAGRDDVEQTRAAAEKALRAAVGRERSYELAHERARKRRMAAAVDVAAAADDYGPVLGWHAHDDDRTTPECRAADGSNFRAGQPPVIGWPGTLHGGVCRCRPGPPHLGGKWTDDVTGYPGRTR
jgi:hypothetical protein